MDTAHLKITNAKTGKEYAYQLAYEGTNEPQALLVQADLQPQSICTLLLQKGKPALFSSKTYCRYVPVRKDDFAWENDQIASRACGKVLEATNENAFGIDVWVKRTDQLILNKRYTLGDGDIAPLKKTQYGTQKPTGHGKF